MNQQLNIFDVMTALQNCRVWLELYRDDAIQKAKEGGVYHFFTGEDLPGVETELTIEACYVYDEEVLQKHDSSIEETLNHNLYLKQTLSSYIKQIKAKNLGDISRIEAIKTGIYLLDQQITSIEQQKNDKKIQICLNITPAFERKMAESIKLLDKEALQLMRLNLGINFTPPPKGYNEPC